MIWDVRPCFDTIWELLYLIYQACIMEKLKWYGPSSSPERTVRIVVDYGI